VLAGLDLPEPDLVVGTSAGAYVASAMFAAPADFSAAVEAWLSAPPEDRRRRVGAVALTVEESWPAPLRLVVVEARSGERVVFGPGDGVPVRTAVAAARSIPGVLPPVTIRDGRYMDGAVGSATNADVAAGAERVVIVTPNPAEAPENALFSIWQQALEEEMDALKRGGSEVLLVQAGSEDQAAMGLDFMSGERAREAFSAGLSRGRLLQYTVRCRR
jgi:NTE family protein